MSRRQDERKKAKGKRQKVRTTRPRRARSFPLFPFFLFPFTLYSEFHITNVPRFQTLQKSDRLVMIKLRIICLDYQKETVACRQRKVRSIENRMIGLRQLVQGQHAEYRCERSGQHGAFKGNRNKRRPTGEWLAP